MNKTLSKNYVAAKLNSGPLSPGNQLSYPLLNKETSFNFKDHGNDDETGSAQGL